MSVKSQFPNPFPSQLSIWQRILLFFVSSLTPVRNLKLSLKVIHKSTLQNLIVNLKWFLNSDLEHLAKPHKLHVISEKDVVY